MLKIVQRHLLFLVVLICALSIPSAVAAAKPSDRPRIDAVPPVSVPRSFIADNSFLFTIGGSTGIQPSQFYGAQVSVGYQFHHVALDLRASIGNLHYGAISVLPGPSDTSTPEPSEGETEDTTQASEATRERTDSDPWSFRQIEPGISVTGQLFATIIPRLSQRARFGIGLARFVDNANNLTFAAFTTTFEADLEYQILQGSRWSLRLGGAWHTGVLRLQEDLGSSTGSLPISWLQTSLSVQYAW